MNDDVMKSQLCPTLYRTRTGRRGRLRVSHFDGYPAEMVSNAWCCNVIRGGFTFGATCRRCGALVHPQDGSQVSIRRWSGVIGSPLRIGHRKMKFATTSPT